MKGSSDGHIYVSLTDCFTFVGKPADNFRYKRNIALQFRISRKQAKNETPTASMTERFGRMHLEWGGRFSVVSATSRRILFLNVITRNQPYNQPTMTEEKKKKKHRSSLHFSISSYSLISMLFRFKQMSRLLTKPTQWLCAQRRLRSESSLCDQWVAKDQRFLQADSEDSDQTGRMPRLIWVLAGHTCHFVGFLMRRLKYCIVMECNLETAKQIQTTFFGVVQKYATSSRTFFRRHICTQGHHVCCAENTGNLFLIPGSCYLTNARVKSWILFYHILNDKNNPSVIISEVFWWKKRYKFTAFNYQVREASIFTSVSKNSNRY